jgi:hypothetical protein
MKVHHEPLGPAAFLGERWRSSPDDRYAREDPTSRGRQARSGGRHRQNWAKKASGRHRRRTPERCASGAEAADVLYHLLVALRSRAFRWIRSEKCSRRTGKSGIEEKAARPQS